MVLYIRVRHDIYVLAQEQQKVRSAVGDTRFGCLYFCANLEYLYLFIGLIMYY